MNDRHYNKLYCFQFNDSFNIQTTLLVFLNLTEEIRYHTHTLTLIFGKAMVRFSIVLLNLKVNNYYIITSYKIWKKNSRYFNFIVFVNNM